MNYISPCNHPESALSGSTVESMIDRTKELNLNYFAITDHGYLTSVLKGYTYGEKKGIKIIPGVELYFKDIDCEIIRNTTSEQIKYFKIIIHAKDQKAYQKIVKMSSDMKRKKVDVRDQKYPLFNWNDLKELCKENITISTSDIECMVSKHLLVGNPNLALKYYKKLRDLVGPENFYPTILPFENSKYWNAIVNIKAGGREIRIPALDRVETDYAKRATAIDLTRRNSKHSKLECVYINKIRYLVSEEFKQIESAELLNDFQDIPDGDLQLKANKFILAVANKFGDKVLINNYSYYANKDDKVVQDMKLGEEERVHQHQYIASLEDIKEYLTNTLKLSEEQINTIVLNSNDFAHKFDELTLKYGYKLPNPGENPHKQMLDVIKKTGRMKWDDPVYKKQFIEEFKLLTDNEVIDLVPYFLPIVDVYDFYKENGFLTGPGRGSAGGFLLSYLMGITHIDPIKYALSTSRFLTIDRIQQGNLPDIDCDLESRVPLVGSDGNSGYLFNRYGNKAAQISTRTLLRIKSAILDANRFINGGKVEDNIAKLSKSLPNTPQGTSDYDYVFGYEDNDGNHIEGLLEKNEELQIYASERPKEWDIVKRALSLARQHSRHACAYLISDSDIEDTIPVFEIGGVERVTQPEAKQCEWAGLIKYDFLVVSALRDINLCLKLINKKNKDNSDEPVGWYHSVSDSFGCIKCHPNIFDHQDGELDELHEDTIVNRGFEDLACPDCNKKIADINKHETGYFTHKGEKTYIWDLPEDENVFKMMSRGETESIFQLNTTSVTPFVKKIRPQNIIDCATITSLVRPGPLDFIDETTGRNMVEEYVERKNGRGKSDIPILEEMLPETYGVLVFQEQVTKLAKELAGMNVIDSENVRIAVGKKKEKLIKSLKPIFVEGASKKVGEETATKIWDMMETFARYGFNKSHAVAYSVISYACAFLKYHYSLEWWAAVLSNADDKEIKEVFYKYTKDMVLPPDINTSTEEMEVDYTAGKIRNKLSIISGLGTKAANKIMELRPYNSIKDLIRKKACGSSMAKKLIHVGVLDSLFPKNYSLVQKINEYEIAVREIEFESKLMDYEVKIGNFKLAGDEKGMERTVKNRNKYKERGPKDPESTMFYDTMTSKQDFMIKKSIFPTMNLDLQSVLEKDSNTLIIKYPQCTKVVNRYGKESRMLTGEGLQKIDNFDVKEEIFFCTPGYVIEASEFTYHGGKKALKVIIDSSGYISEKVIWPDYNTGELEYPKLLKKGCIAYFFYKKKQGKPYTNIWDIIVEESSIL